ncbi:MAG: hypothetical protein M0001_13620 [Treponema sp.]|nr:hypothetical protein [Treponema sp.]
MQLFRTLGVRIGAGIDNDDTIMTTAGKSRFRKAPNFAEDSLDPVPGDRTRKRLHRHDHDPADRPPIGERMEPHAFAGIAPTNLENLVDFGLGPDAIAFRKVLAGNDAASARIDGLSTSSSRRKR